MVVSFPLKKHRASVGRKIPVVPGRRVKICLNKFIPNPESLLGQEGLNFVLTISTKAEWIWVIYD